MTEKQLTHKTYFELAEHSRLQLFIFAMIFCCCFVFCICIILPFIKDFFENFLLAKVHDSGAPLPYNIQHLSDPRQPSYLLSWAIDFDVKSSNPTRYWFNPLLSISLIVSLFSVGISAIITAFLPQQVGFLRQKIEREIANLLDKLSIAKFGFFGKDEQREVAEEILNSDLRDLHEMASEFSLTVEDLKILRKGLIWLNSSFLKRVITFNDGVKVYMRFYFTTQYSNTMLGYVYIGAAFLIISIGLRGIKFIPPSQPSLILFALGLEFCLLLVFAITTIYTRQDEDNEAEHIKSGSANAFGSNYQTIGNDYGTAKEIERLLKVFIKSNKDK